MNYRLLFIFLIFSGFSVFFINAEVISFENGDFSNWNVSKGNLSISTEKVKLGNNSLCWEWTAQDILTVTEPSIQNSALSSTGGISMWIYNTQKVDDILTICFYENQTQAYSLSFSLNFEGWRCLWSMYKQDMKIDNNVSILNNMKIKTPEKGNGKIFIDYVEFTQNTSWERMSDFQYQVKENNSLQSFLKTWNYQPENICTATDEHKKAVRLIGQRIEKWIYGSDKYITDGNFQLRKNNLKNYVTRGVKNYPTISENGTINGSGLFSLAYDGKTVDNIKLVTFRDINEKNLIQLAYNQKMNIVPDADNFQKMTRLLDYYFDQGWAAGSALGTLRFEMLRSAGYFYSVYMVRNELDSIRLQKILDSLRWFTLFGETYINSSKEGETADKIRTLALPKLLYALMLPDENECTTAMYALQNYLNNALKTTSGFWGTFKPDGSGYHHYGPYFSAYYPDALYASCFLFYLLKDTPFALNDEVYDNLKKALLSFRFLCGEYNVPGALTGRFPSQANILQQLIPAYAYLALCKQDDEILATLKKLWQPNNQLVQNYISTVKTDICFTTTLGEIECVLDALSSSVEAELNPIGSSYFPYSGLLVVRHPDWMITIKGFSKYIWDYESSETENIYGRYQSYGQIEYHDFENKYKSYDIQKADEQGLTEWDWRLLPGTTVKNVSIEKLNVNATKNQWNNYQIQHRNFSDQPFLGGIGFNEKYAIFTNRIHDNAIDTSFYADKSTFIFDNEIFCIGSGIKDKNTTLPFYTVLFQNKGGNGNLYVSGNNVDGDLKDIPNAVIKDNFDNVYLVHEGKTNISKGTSICKAYINHGYDIINGAKYAYSWLIKPTEKQVQDYSSNRPIIILSQNDTAHAVYHSKENVLAASIFKANTIVDIQEIHQVNKPLILMLKKEEEENLYELAFSDPDFNRRSAKNTDKITPEIEALPSQPSKIVVELNGDFYKADNTESKINVTFSSDITTISYDSACEGKTYRVLLKKNDSNQQELIKNNIIIERNNKNILVYLCDSGKYSWTLYNVQGQILQLGNGNGDFFSFNMNNKYQGMYILKINVDNKKHIFKLVI